LRRNDKPKPPCDADHDITSPFSFYKTLIHCAGALPSRLFAAGKGLRFFIDTFSRPPRARATMSALFDFNSFLTVVLLFICSCTYYKLINPSGLTQRTG
jgi:hypothetical protein